MSWRRQKEFIGRYVKFARETAWGGNMPIPGVDTDPAPSPPPETRDDEESSAPQAVNRRQRRMMEKESRKEGAKIPSKKARKAASKSNSKNSSRDASVAPAGVRKRVVAENGKVLVVDSYGDVFLEEQDEEGNVNEYLLDVSIHHFKLDCTYGDACSNNFSAQ